MALGFGLRQLEKDIGSIPVGAIKIGLMLRVNIISIFVRHGLLQETDI